MEGSLLSISQWHWLSQCLFFSLFLSLPLSLTSSSLLNTHTPTHTCLSICLYIYKSIYLSIYLSSVYYLLPIYVYVSIRYHIYMSMFLSIIDLSSSIDHNICPLSSSCCMVVRDSFLLTVTTCCVTMAFLHARFALWWTCFSVRFFPKYLIPAEIWLTYYNWSHSYKHMLLTLAFMIDPT